MAWARAQLVSSSGKEGGTNGERGGGGEVAWAQMVFSYV